MTTLQAAVPAGTTNAWDTIRRETVQTSAVGAIGGAAVMGLIGPAGDVRGKLGFMLAGAIIGGAAGVGAGAARGGVDAATGTGIGPALAQTGAAVVAGAAAGVGGLFLASVVPGARGAVGAGAGMGALYCAVGGAMALGAAVLAPPIMDKLGILD